jgi:hypothetical protein
MTCKGKLDIERSIYLYEDAKLMPTVTFNSVGSRRWVVEGRYKKENERRTTKKPHPKMTQTARRPMQKVMICLDVKNQLDKGLRW